MFLESETSTVPGVDRMFDREAKGDMRDYMKFVQRQGVMVARQTPILVLADEVDCL